MKRLARAKRLLKLPLNFIGLDLVRLSQTARQSGHVMPSWSERIRHTRNLGFRPQVILDGGAFRGLWSLEIAQVFPGARIILVEPNPHVQDEIRKNIVAIRPAPLVVIGALGNKTGTATLNLWKAGESDTSASLLAHVSGEAKQKVTVKVDTIDNIFSHFALQPDLLKLDLQGGELDALQGATECLKRAELCLIEFSCLNAYIDRATPRDLLEVMYDNDYCLYDIVDCHYRPYDGALTGGDFVFVKNSSVLRRHRGWA